MQMNINKQNVKIMQVNWVIYGLRLTARITLMVVLVFEATVFIEYRIQMNITIHSQHVAHTYVHMFACNLNQDIV